MGFVAIVGILCLIYGMALSGALYYTNNYESCYVKRPAHNTELTMSQSAAEFHNFRMMILQGRQISNAMVSMDATSHTDQIGYKLHTLYRLGRGMMWVGVILSLAAYLYFHSKRQYRVIRKAVTLSLILPVAAFLLVCVLKPMAMLHMTQAVVLNQYAAVFYDDPDFVSILPGGIFAGYAVRAVLIWLIATAVFYAVFKIKREHRRPHEF